MSEVAQQPQTPHEGACTCPACAPTLWAAGIKGAKPMNEVGQQSQQASSKERTCPHGISRTAIPPCNFCDHEQYVEWVTPQLERLGREMEDNARLRGALDAVRAKLSEYLERLLQKRTLPNRWVGEINEIVSAALSGDYPSAPETPTDEQLQTERDTYCFVLGKLVRKLEAVHEDPRYKAVWESYMIHGGRYDEPTYTEEFEAAKKILKYFTQETKAGQAASEFLELLPDLQRAHMTLCSGISTDQTIEARHILTRVIQRMSPMELPEKASPICPNCADTGLVEYDAAHGEPRSASCPHQTPSVNSEWICTNCRRKWLSVDGGVCAVCHSELIPLTENGTVKP